MDDKYYLLQRIVIDKFDLDAPIEIEKADLLLGKDSWNIFLQMKLNVLDLDISRLSSVSLRIDCLNDAMETISEISPFIFTYRDIFLIKSKSFGENSPILLDKRVRRVKVGIDRVVFTDTSIWKPTSQTFTPSKQELISSLMPELVEQFQRDIRDLSPAAKERYIFIPEQLDDCWLCTCGRPNKIDAVTCSRCGLSKEKVFTIAADTLQKNLDEHKKIVRLKEEKARLEKENIRLLEIEKAKKQEEDKVVINRMFFITVIFAALIGIYAFVISPAIKYSQASKYLSNKDFDNAISIFESLDNYKDSEEMVYAANYYKASLLVANHEYDSAISIFETLGDYKDSSSLLNEGRYQKAVELLNGKNYLNAVNLLILLGDYKDSATLLLEAKYQLGLWYLNEPYICEEVISIFSSLGSYKDSERLLIQAREKKPCPYSRINSTGNSPSSNCKTLRDNLALALLLSGGEETDLTRLYRKALRDENCGD